MMRIIFGVLLCGFISLPAFSAEVIIKFKDSVSSKHVSLIKSYGGDIKSLIPQLNMAVVKLPQGVSAFLKGVLANVEYVAPNGLIHLNLPADKPSTEGLWGLEAVNVEEAWKITIGTKDVIVALSDTGIYMKHKELKDNLWNNPGETGMDSQGKDKSKNHIDDDGNGYIDDVYGWNFDDDNNSPGEKHYHGTHVAGTIGASYASGGISGVATLVSLMNVKFIGSNGSGTTDAAVRSILYAADNGAKAVNCSWGSKEYSQPLYDAILYAQSKGVLIVAAAGNNSDNTDKKFHYPSGYSLDNVISVAATSNDSGNLAYFSNYGLTTVDLGAPGAYIYSTFNPNYFPMDPSPYNTLSGTSMAAPHVTGTVALIYSVNPHLSYLQVKDIILSTVTPAKSLLGKVVTGGQLNVGEAVKKASSSP